MSEASAPRNEDAYEQLDLFTDYAALEEKKKAEKEKLARERKLQEAELNSKPVDMGVLENTLRKYSARS